MKKVFLAIFMMFIFVTVNASVKPEDEIIKMESVKLEVNEKIGYNEEVKVKFTVNPRDSKDVNLMWSVVGLEDGVTVDFVSSSTTNSSDGEIVLKVNNSLDRDVVLTLRAAQKGEVYGRVDLNVESRANTSERVVKELDELIGSLDEEINSDNYEDNKSIVEKVDKLLKENPDLKLGDELNAKYLAAKESVNNFKPENKGVVIGVSAGLAAAFSGLLYWIFKKENK